MLKVEQIDTDNRAQARRFVRLHFKLYEKCPQWVPPLLGDCESQVNRQKNPYFEHSAGEFFMATRDGEDVGRIAVHINKPFNQYHGTHKANFYLFDCIDDQEVANALFERAFDWARQRGMDTIIGPKGFSAFDGYGIQVEGFQHHQMMNTMNYNYDYYPRLAETAGFTKEVDFVSCYIRQDSYRFDERIMRIAERVEARGKLKVLRFQSKAHMKTYADKIGTAYNQTFINNWEYYPLTEREVKFALNNMMMVADHRLIKIITHEDKVVGFLFAFPDISRAMQRAKGRLFPFGLVDMLRELKRTDWVSLNGVGILPEFQGIGGNALLYAEMVKTVTSPDFNFVHAELTQVAETAVQMRRDLVNLGGKPYKNHRVYRRAL